MALQMSVASKIMLGLSLMSSTYIRYDIVSSIFPRLFEPIYKARIPVWL